MQQVQAGVHVAYQTEIHEQRAHGDRRECSTVITADNAHCLLDVGFTEKFNDIGRQFAHERDRGRSIAVQLGAEVENLSELVFANAFHGHVVDAIVSSVLRFDGFFDQIDIIAKRRRFDAFSRTRNDDQLRSHVTQVQIGTVDRAEME